MDYSTRYKESNPLDTVERIRKILKGLDILTVEKWTAEVKGYYSLHMMIDGLNNVFSNGKGTTAEFALASAYAELIERLQNLGFVKWNQGMSKMSLDYKGFHLAPDEKRINKKELLRNINKWFSHIKHDKSIAEFNKKKLNKWKTVNEYENWEENTGLPYMNLTDGSVYYLPISRINELYGSNGMCAGNSGCEALVQGLSEVIERYVQTRIVLERIVPPTIPDSYISANFPHIHSMIKELEGKGNFKVIVKDCSLGKGLPVTAIYFIDRSSHSYLVRFGSHPSFDISLERCLTELLQGKSINNLSWTVQLYFSEKDIFNEDNINNMFVNGQAFHPVEMFTENYSYEFKEVKDLGGCDNKTMLSYLTGIIHSMGGNILVRDVSFLGFPAYHIIVPFMSEIINCKSQYLSSISGMGKIPSLMMHLEKVNDGDLMEIIDAILKDGYNPGGSIADLFHKSLSVNSPWHNIKIEFFLSCAYYKLGDIEKAYHFIGRFVSGMKADYNSPDSAYYNCMKDYFGALVNGRKSLNNTRVILKKFYAEGIVEQVFTSLENPGDIFKAFSGLNCFNCEECIYKRHCNYPAREKLFMRMKDIYSGNVIDQKRVASILN